MVKVSVRAYCKNRVIEFIPATKSPLTELGKVCGYDPVELLVQWSSVSREGNVISFLSDVPLAGTVVPFLPLVKDCVSHIDEVMTEIRNCTFSIITEEIKESYERWRKTYLPYANDVSNLDGYATRIGETSPLFTLFETDILPYAPSTRLDPRVTSFNDEEFNRRYEVLRAVSIPCVGVGESRSRAFVIQSQVAADITTKIRGTQETPSALFLVFEDHVSSNHKQYAAFYEDQCKFSSFGSIRYVKAKVVAETSKAVSNYLAAFISRLYTPLLKSFEDHVEKVLQASKSDIVLQFTLLGTRCKLLATSLISLGVETINALMFLFNDRENEIYKQYSNKKKTYYKNYFCPAEVMVSIFNTQKRGSFDDIKEYSRVIFPYRQNHGNSRYSISLVIMIPKQRKVLLLDLYRSLDESRRLLPTIKIQFDRYYGKNFTFELYLTIPENVGIIDTFDRMSNLTEFSSDQPTIYMYVAIYYVLFGCPLIFDSADICNKYFRDRIKYEILKKMLFL
jgi:hypothetical protein